MTRRINTFGTLSGDIDRDNTLETKTWEKVGWHHQLNGHEFELTLGDSGGQRSLVCCSPWGHKESDMT